jgi:hypothetical protein
MHTKVKVGRVGVIGWVLIVLHHITDNLDHLQKQESLHADLDSHHETNGIMVLYTNCVGIKVRKKYDKIRGPGRTQLLTIRSCTSRPITHQNLH